MGDITYVRGSADLFASAQAVLETTQEKLGQLLGVSRRSIIRFQQRGTILLPHHIEVLARACYPKDRAFAAGVAAFGGTTLAQLGIEPAVQPEAGAAPATPQRAAPTARHLGDSIVCAAAEAMQSTPQAARPALVAAFERAVALGLDATQALAAITLPAPAPESPAASSTRPAKSGKAGSG